MSSLGRVRSVRPWARGYRPPRILQTFPSSVLLYPTVCLCGDGGIKAWKTVHQLVCAAFHGPPPSPDHEVAHGDGDPMNANAGNLRWATHEDNMADKKRHGTHFVGESTSGAKLTEAQVIELRFLATQGIADEVLASRFNVAIVTVNGIRRGRSWGWLNAETTKRKPPAGEAHKKSKLNTKVVLEIRASSKQHAVLAAKYGIDQSTVSDVKRRRTWKHI